MDSCSFPNGVNYTFKCNTLIRWIILKKGDHSPNIPSSLRFWDKTTSGFKDKLNYVYDKLGNISKIYENGKLLVRYAYDGVNRLIPIGYNAV